MNSPMTNQSVSLCALRWTARVLSILAVGCRSFVRLWGRIKLVAFYCSRVGFIRLLPNRSLSGDGSGLAVGGFWRRHHRSESRRLLSGATPHVVELSEGLCFCGAGCARFSVSSMLAVGTFNHKAAWDLTSASHARRSLVSFLETLHLGIPDSG